MSFTGGGDVVGQAFVQIHAVPAPGLDAETAAIAARTGAAVQGQLAGSLTKTSKSLNTAALGIVAALGLIGKKAVTSFSDTVEALNVVDIAFGRNAAGVKKWALGLNSSFGLTNKTILATAGNFGLLFENAGLGIDASTQLAQALTERAADLSSLFNIPGAEAVEKVTSGILGEVRAIRSLGVDVSETAVKNKAFELGIKSVGGELTQQQKLLIRARLVLEQTTKAQGDAIRTAGTFEGRLRTLRGEIGDLAEKIGKDLIPSLGLIGVGAEEAVKTLNEAPDPLRAIAVNVGAAGTAAVAAAFAWQKLAPAVASVRGAIGITASAVKLGASLLLDLGATALLGPVGAVAGLIALGKATAPPIAGIKELNDLLGNSPALLDAFFTKAFEEHNPSFLDTAREFFSVALGADIDPMAETAEQLRKTLDAVFATDPALARRIVETAERAGNEYAGGLRAELDKLAPIVPDIVIPVAVDVPTIEEAAASIRDLFRDTDAVNAANVALAGATKDVAKAQTELNAVLKAGATKEIADQRERLADATQSVADALRRQADAQDALNKLNAPASERELADAADEVTRAEIALAQATRARDEALKALEPRQVRALNLAGQSLDQLRTTLAVERATLATKRTAAKGEDPAVLQETAVEAEIDLRQAKDKVTDAQAALLELQNKGKVATDETEAAERALEDAKRATIRAQHDQQEEERALASLLAGNTQFAKDAAAAGETLAAAKERQRSAEADVRDAVAIQKDDVASILGNQIGISNELRTQIGLHRDLFTSDTALRRNLVENTLAGIGARFMGPLSPAQIDAVFAGLLGDPSRLVELLKRLGFTVEGHELGGLITRPTLSWLGEKSKHELVLPITDPARTWGLLSKHLPEFTAPRPSTIEAAPLHRPASGARSALPSEAPMTAAQAERIIALLERIERKPAAGNDVDINVHPTPGMSEAALIRKARKELARYWGAP